MIATDSPLARTGMKIGTVLFISLIFTAADAMSRSGVSSKFDGTYEGAMTPETGLSNPACKAVTIDEFVIREGTIRPPAKIAQTDAVIFDGFVTEEGFVTGHVRQGMSEHTFEGRMTDETGTFLLSGGVMNKATGCAWLVELRKQ